MLSQNKKNKDFVETCVEIFDNIDYLKNSSRFLVAVSGGIDSLSLTFLANYWANKNNKKLFALTIDHKLRPTSTNEAYYIHKLLENNSIEHHILTWEGNKPITNIESLARDARYNLIFEFCKKNNIDIILLGHHLQDQAENFLIRLFRGSGISGLSSMQMVTKRNGFTLIRPFLNIKKEDLKKYLINQNIQWVEDESNSDEKYLRNKIRNFLNSFEDKENIIKRINLTIDIFQNADNIINNKVNELENCVYFYDKEYNYYKIKLYEFLKLDKEIQYRILLKISKKVSQNTINPRFIKIDRLINNLETLKKYTFYGCIFEKINTNEFVCYREYNSIKDKTNYLKRGELNKYLKFLKENNYPKYKEIKDFKGYKKELLYTIPIK